MSTEIEGFMAKLRIAAEGQRKAALAAVDRFGEHVIGDAQQLCPVLTGALQASGTTEPAELKGEGGEKLIGFNTSYAAAVHEKLDAQHKVGQAKFLEAAMRDNQPKFGLFVAEAVKNAEGGD